MISKRARRKTVLATGAFDIIHPGHIRFLQESKRRGGPGARLIVVVARDATVLHRKGRRPVIPESQRREIVSMLKPVDHAVLGHQRPDFLGILERYRPDIVAFGYDQTEVRMAVEKIIRKEKLPTRIVQIRRFGPRGLDSSSTVKERIASLYGSH